MTVVDPRWVAAGRRTSWSGSPRGHRLVVTVEDGGRPGGVGAALTDALRAAECDVPVRVLALPQQFLEHGTRADVLAALGLTAQDVARRHHRVDRRPAGTGRRRAAVRRLDTRELGRRAGS